jgi:Tfp pilus assembly protein PilZ
MNEGQKLADYDLRRAYPRKSYGKEIVFSHSDTIYRGVLKNISLGGVRIETSNTNHFAKGETITVSIPFSSGNKNIKCKGRIVWLNEAGFSIEFI